MIWTKNLLCCDRSSIVHFKDGKMFISKWFIEILLDEDWMQRVPKVSVVLFIYLFKYIYICQFLIFMVNWFEKLIFQHLKYFFRVYTKHTFSCYFPFLRGVQKLKGFVVDVLRSLSWNNSSLPVGGSRFLNRLKAL